ncbi:MAG: DUF6602 domain-containing protein [Candidatus Kapaibacteriota bacterium]
MLYDGYLETLAEKIQSQFNTIETVHNFDHGNEFEVALCQILRNFLPTKYGVCRGFVVSRDGTKAGDDIVIFDQERFPTLRLLKKDDFAIKEQIPIEAVYAYIEAKHSLTEEAFEKSMAQIIAVKRLCLKRDRQQLYQFDPYISANGRAANQVEYLPDYRNPIFTMVFSRFGMANQNTDAESIKQFLCERLYKLSNEHLSFFPELIIAGNSNFLSTGYKKDEKITPTLFHLDKANASGYQVMKTPGIAYGIAFAHLAAAIDWIRLGKMPWEDIINDSKLQNNAMLEIPIYENANKPLEVNFSPTSFVNGYFKIEHNKGYKPQVSVLDENGDEVGVVINKSDKEVTIGAIRGFAGKVIIS